MDSNAVELEKVTKNFRIYHEKRNTFFEHMSNIFNRNRHFEILEVLKDISFSVQKGEMFGIVGRNGAGKSTILKLISGILKPDTGIIWTKGSIIPLLELGAGFQPDLTARDNIILYGIILGFSRREITEKVDDILKFGELERFADTRVKTFSSGMYARLAFSTAIQVDPDILLVDEILAVGDLSFRQKSFEAFTSFRERGKTIIYVSQNMESVKKLCDRALLLDEGVIKVIGTPDIVVDSYEKTLSSPPTADQKLFDIPIKLEQKIEKTKDASNSFKLNGLVAHLTFDDDASDSCKNLSDGSINGARFVDGKFGQALSFDGVDDYVSIPNSHSINLGLHDKISISLWFKVNDKRLASKQVIWSQGGLSRGLNIYVFDSSLYIGGWNTPPTESGWKGTFLSTPSIQSGKWHHVVLVLEGTEMVQLDALRAYLDGQPFGGGDGSQLWEHSVGIGIGGVNHHIKFHDGISKGGGHFFGGLIDDICIYAKALTTSEVTHLFNGKPYTKIHY
ncbi:MAG: ATP-binding cassette domain-containing protein [Nitrososphaerales archaeon]